jgi:hypothetical protein
MVVMYIEKVPNRNSPPPFFDLIPIEKEIKSKKETGLSKLPDDIIDNLKLALKGALQSR